MKLVFVGGGSHRYVGIARSALALDGLLENGEINLYDPAVHRAQAVGQLVQKSPEYQSTNCKITWGTTLDEALEGADIVMVVLMAGGRLDYAISKFTAQQHGFLGTDQLSPSGAILSLKGGPILMDIAQRMERLCPNAWLVDFANPVAVLSAAVNNHTKIKCMGVCAGYTNHQWDLTRLLYGKDEQWNDYEFYSAGVNHMAFILPGSTHRGRDIFELTDEFVLRDDWTVPTLSSRWSEVSKASISNAVQTLRNYYIKYRQLVFSTEGDGLAHLDMEGRYQTEAHLDPSVTLENIKRDFDAKLARLEKSETDFAAWLSRDMTHDDWFQPRPEASYLWRVDEDIMVKIIKAVGFDKPLRIATSFPNRGAVEGFTDRTVLEYSQILRRDSITPAKHLDVPNVFRGLIGSLASHQTLLGDSIATEDPRVLFEALYSYPVKQDTAESKAMWKALLLSSKDKIPAVFQETRNYF